MQATKREQALIKIVWLINCTLLFSFSVFAQTSSKPPPPPPRPSDSMSADRSSPSDDGPPLTTYEEEIRAKRLIKIAEKEHQENINRAREISQLGKELKESLKKRTTLDRDDNKRLDRIEKLTKKVRGEAGGEADEIKIDGRPTDAESTLTRLVEVTECLSKNVESTPRQVVSAAVIDNANVLLELVRIMRGFYVSR